MPEQLKQKDLKQWRDTRLGTNNVCPLCSRTIKSPVADHSHLGEPHEHHLRSVLCSTCNTTAGSVWKVLVRSGTVNALNKEGAVQFLVNLGSYYSKDYSAEDYHPNRIKDEVKRFKRLNKDEQIELLASLNVAFCTKQTKDKLVELYKVHLDPKAKNKRKKS